MKFQKLALTIILAVVIVADAEAFFDPNKGRFLSRDPIEEKGGANLFAMCKNAPVDHIDVNGLFLLAVDGTSSATSTHYDPRTHRWNSSVHNFYASYKGPGAKLFIQGPQLMAGDVTSLVDVGVQQICKNYKNHPTEEINLVGHSRGGLIVILVAERLEGQGIKINFMGLYDAVDRARSGDASVIPRNVQFVAHARRSPSVKSRTYFGNTGTSGGMSYVENFFWGTHSAIGGDPWPKEERPSTTTEESEISASIDADEWIRLQATSHNIELSP